MRKFGLIGHPLKHSFSKRYFSEKFEKQGLDNCQYELFDIDDISKITQVIRENPELEGLNVTIPYKEQVIPYLDEMEPGCRVIGAVNTVRIKNGKLTGFNTDYYGFKESLSKWLDGRQPGALILGSGGASRAVKQALADLTIPYLMVSRQKTKVPGSVDYSDLVADRRYLDEHHLIINTTPLGTFPNIAEMPPIPLEYLTDQHLVYDLVYNPATTLLMESAADRGALTKNGHEMLILQAEASWGIWNRAPDADK